MHIRPLCNYIAVFWGDHWKTQRGDFTTSHFIGPHKSIQARGSDAKVKAKESLVIKGHITLRLYFYYVVCL